MLSDGVKWRAKAPEDVVWREVGEEIVVLDLRTSMYWVLNGSAAVLWMALTDWATTEALVERLVDEFGIDAEAATTDVSKFLSSCEAQHFLDRTPRLT